MKRYFLLSFFVLLMSSLYANIICINFENLQRYDNLQDDIIFLQKNYTKVNYWTPSWEHSVSKTEMLNSLLLISEKLEKLIQTNIDDIDIHLLLLTVYQYQYNLEYSSTEKFYGLIAQTERLFFDDYRPIWLLAEFYSNSSRQKESVVEYQKFIENAEDLNYIHPMAIYDYAMTCFLSRMYRTSKISLELFAKKTHSNLNDIPLYRVVSEKLMTSNINSVYEANMIWKTFSENEKNILYSRFWGLRIGCNEKWSIGYSKYENRQSSLFIKPEVILSKKNNKITYNIYMTFMPLEGSLEKIVDKFIETQKNILQVSEKKIKTYNNKQYVILSIVNTDLYSNNGGMNGYAIFVDNIYTNTSGFNLEIVDELPQETGLNIYRPTHELDTLKTNVYAMIIVDSCKEIEKETDSDVEDFLRNLYW